MLTPDDAGIILSDLGALIMQSVEESSSSNVSTPRVIISELKCHGEWPHYIRFGPLDVAFGLHDFHSLGEQRGSTMDSESDQHQGSSLVFFVGSQGLQEPISFPSCPPSQGSLLLAN